MCVSSRGLAGCIATEGTRLGQPVSGRAVGRSAKAVTSRPARTWLLAGVLGMLGVALSSGLKPWAAAIAGAVVPADLAADVAAAHLFVQGISPYGSVIRPVHEALTGLP